jgi:hypothetical protein
MQRIKVAAISLGFLVSFGVVAEELQPQQYASVSEMIEDMGDFSAEKGTFAVLSEKPLQIRVAAAVVPGDLPENVNREVRRAALYGVYRTFVHTAAESVQVTAVPNQITFNPYSSTLLKSPTLKITVTRWQALEAAKALTGAGAMEDLVTPEKTGSFQLDNWSKSFEPLYYKDDGQAALLKAIKAAGGDLVNNG